MAAHVSEPVPLRRALRVHVVCIIVGDPVDEGLDRVSELLAVKGRGLGNVQRQAITSISTCIANSMTQAAELTSTGPARRS